MVLISILVTPLIPLFGLVSILIGKREVRNRVAYIFITAINLIFIYGVVVPVLIAIFRNKKRPLEIIALPPEHIMEYVFGSWAFNPITPISLLLLLFLLDDKSNWRAGHMATTLLLYCGYAIALFLGLGDLLVNTSAFD
jgi:hypothetical protein